MPLTQRVDISGIAVDLYVGGGGQTIHPRIEGVGGFNRHALVRPPCREHPDVEARIRGNGQVVFE